MIVTQQVQHTMHQQMRGMRFRGFFLLFRLANDGLARKYNIAQRLSFSRKRQYVRGLVFAAIAMIEFAHQRIVSQYNGDFPF